MQTYFIPEGTTLLRRKGKSEKWHALGVLWEAFVTTRDVRFTDEDIEMRRLDRRDLSYARNHCSEIVFNIPKNRTLYRQICVSVNALHIEDE
jgi:hypothetical protein